MFMKLMTTMTQEMEKRNWKYYKDFTLHEK